MANGCYLRYVSWIILAFAALNVIFLGGKRRAFGSFIDTLSHIFSNVTYPLTELDWIGDSYSAFGYMSISVSTAAIIKSGRKYRVFQFIGSLLVLASCISSSFAPNPHWLFLTHTLIHGIGSSFILSTIGLVVNEHFSKTHKYHILATTLVSGGSVASILFIEFFAYLIQTYGWRASFRILGVIYFLVTASAAIFFQTSKEKKDYVMINKQDKRGCKDVVTKRHIPLIILWFLDRILTSSVTYGLLMNLTKMKDTSGDQVVKSSKLTMLFASGEAVTYLIGAILTAITGNFFKNRLKYFLIVTSFTMSASLVAIGFLPDIPWLEMLLMFIAGFSLGPSITFLYPGGEELTCLPGDIAYPISLGGMGFGMMISPMASAYIIQRLPTQWFYFTQAGLIFIKFIALILISILSKIFIKLDPEFKSIQDESISDSIFEKANRD